MRTDNNTANLEGRQDLDLQGCFPQTLGLLTKTEQRSPLLELLLPRGRCEMRWECVSIGHRISENGERFATQARLEI